MHGSTVPRPGGGVTTRVGCGFCNTPLRPDAGAGYSWGVARKSGETVPSMADGTASAAVLIVAHDHARQIAATVRAARAIPGVDLVLVVDDASSDNTQELARKAGAVTVRNSHSRGRTAAIELG